MIEGRFWSRDNASTTGAALAFFCAFSLAPLLVILLTIAGVVLGEQAAYGDIQSQLSFGFILALGFLLLISLIRWRTVIAGGILTAVLFDVGRWGVGLYLAHSTQPSAFGAAASFAAPLLWLYYTAQIFLFGAEFTACLAGGREETDVKAQTELEKAT